MLGRLRLASVNRRTALATARLRHPRRRPAVPINLQAHRQKKRDPDQVRGDGGFWALADAVPTSRRGKAVIADRMSEVQNATMNLRRLYTFLVIFALWGDTASARSKDSAHIAAGGGHCGRPPVWWAQNLEDLQTFHLITVGPGSRLRWNGKRVSFAQLESRLKTIGRGRLALANQVGIRLAQNGSCATRRLVRATMERLLDCRASMCRDGDLDQPPPPPHDF